MRTIDGEQMLARVFFRDGDAWNGERLVHALPKRLRSEGFAGCTMFRSTMGFGVNGRLHVDLVEGSPPNGFIVEVVDDAARIDQLLALLDEMLEEGMVTIERARVVAYRADPPRPAP